MKTQQPLQEGDRLPYLLLPSAPDGQSRQLQAQRGFSSVMLLLHATDCALCHSYVEQLVAEREELLEWDTQVVAIFSDDLASVIQWQKQREQAAGVSVLALADVEQRASAQCGLQAPGLLIADQWGKLYFVQQVGEEHQFLSPAEVVNWAQFIAIQCPECQAEAF